MNDEQIANHRRVMDMPIPSMSIEYADEEFTFAGLMDFVAEWAIVILAGIAALIFGAVVTLPLWFLK